MKAYSLVEFNRKNITLTTKNILIYKIKTMTQTSTNTHLKEFKGFEIINRREKVKRLKKVFLTKKLMNNFLIT